MFLNIGDDRLMPLSEMIVVVSVKGDKGMAKNNKIFFDKRMEEGDVISLTNFFNAKNMIITKNNLVFLSSIVPRTVFKRPKKKSFRKG